MKKRTIGALTLLLIVLGFVYYFDYRRETERESAEVKASRLLPFASQEANTLTIRNSHGIVEMEKRADGWWITSPVVDRADQFLITETLLPELEKARKSNPFQYSRKSEAGKKKESGRAEDSYGLIKSPLSLTLRTASNGESTQLTFGSETPVPGEIYVIDESSPNTVYVTESKIREPFMKVLSSFRDKTVLEFDPLRVEALWVKRTSDTLAARREPNGDWKMDETVATSGPLRRSADKIIMENLLRHIQETKVMGFVSTSTSQLSLYGLDQPRATIEMRDRKTTGTTATTATAATGPLETVGPLFIGNRVEGKGGGKPFCYAMRRGRDAIFLINSQLVDALLKPIVAYSDRRIFTLPSDQVSYLQIEAIVSAMAFARDKAGIWHLINDFSKPIDQEKINGYVAYCLGLRAEEYPDPPIMDPKQVHLNAPSLRVTMADEGRKVRQGFEIGATPKDRPFFYARRSPLETFPGEPSIFLIGLPLEGFYSLMRTPDYFLIKKILAFDPPNVQKIIWNFKQEGDKPGLFTMTREKGASTWKATVGSKSSIVPENQANLLLSTLAALEYEALVKDVTKKDLKAVNLDPPPNSIHLFDAKDKELGAVSFGNSGKKEKMLVINAQGQYLLMETKLISGAGQVIDEIINRMN